MILARIVGTVVATRKDPRLEGKKLLVVKPVSPEGADEPGYLVAVDTVSAGFRETVLDYHTTMTGFAGLLALALPVGAQVDLADAGVVEPQDRYDANLSPNRCASRSMSRL